MILEKKVFVPKHRQTNAKEQENRQGFFTKLTIEFMSHEIVIENTF